MCSSDASSRRTASQNSASPGASTTSPHTVIARRPPGASHCPRPPQQAGHVVHEEEAEHRQHRVERRRRHRQRLDVARPRSAPASDPQRWPERGPARRATASGRRPAPRPTVPTARAAGSADAPVPQHRSSTRSPGARCEPLHRAPSVLVPEGQRVEVIGRRRVGGDDARVVGHGRRRHDTLQPLSGGPVPLPLGTPWRDRLITREARALSCSCTTG